jgi:outer membrane protein assembly factor BamB
MGLIRGTLGLIGALVKVLVLLIVVGAAGYFTLTKVFGARIERDGTGFLPIVSFAPEAEDHIAALERERAAQPPAPAPDAPPVAEAEAEVQAAEAGAATPEPAPEMQAAPAPPAPWPDYRGPARDGVIEGVSIRQDWPLEQLWRTKVGGGYASMVVAEGKIYTIEQRRGQEVAAAYDLATGHELWTHAWDADFQEAMGGPGPRATPTYASGRVYALGALGDLRALKASNGELVWKTNILADAGAANIQWGMSGAPLAVDGRLIVNAGGSGGKSVTAYDAGTGKILWQSLDDKAGYASPQLMTLAGKQQVVVFTGERLVSLDPADGRELWALDWRTDHNINSAQPIQVSGDRIWFSSGYGHGSALAEIRETAGGFEAKKLWETNTMKNKFNSSLLYQGHIYGLDDGILSSIDVETGARDWKAGRYGFGQLLLAGGYIIVLTEKGELVLVKATPESHQEVARFPVLEGKTWNVPAYAGGKLLVRNQTEMAAYQLVQ